MTAADRAIEWIGANRERLRGLGPWREDADGLLRSVRCGVRACPLSAPETASGASAAMLAARHGLPLEVARAIVHAADLRFGFAPSVRDALEAALRPEAAL